MLRTLLIYLALVISFIITATVNNQETLTFKVGLLFEKVKISDFHEIFQRIPVELLYFGMKENISEAIGSFQDGEITSWSQFTRMIINHFEERKLLELDEDKMALFSVFQHFWRGDRQEILDEIAPELKDLITFSRSCPHFVTNMVLKMLKCKTVEENRSTYTGV